MEGRPSSLASPRPVSPSSTSGPGLSFSAECSPVSGLQLHPVTSPLLQVRSQHTAVLQICQRCLTMFGMESESKDT